MSCDVVEPELLGYHFGTLDPSVRAVVEGHLPTCASCLGAFIALKRDLEAGDEEPAPSAGAAQEIRRAVARELQPPKAPWWQLPVAWTAALAAGLLAVASVHSIARGDGAPPRSAPTTKRL